MYGHLLVMAIINITIPFLLITWAEQSVDSSLAAILTSPVPLFAIVLSALFLVDEPMRVNGVLGLVVGFIGVVILTSPRPDRRRVVASSGELALLGAAFSYACGAVYARRNVRGLAPMIPAVFQVSFAAIITAIARAAARASVDRSAGHRGDLLDPVARDPRVGDRLPVRLPAVRRLGRDTDDAGRLRHPGRRHRARLPGPRRAHRRPGHPRNRARDRRGGLGQQPVRSAAGLRAGATDRGGLEQSRAARCVPRRGPPPEN